LTGGYTETTPAALDAPAAARARGRSRRPSNGRAGGAAATATGLLLATAAADEGGPAAALPWGDGTLLRRLLEQLADLGVRRAHVVCRPQWERELRPSADGLGVSLELHVSAGPAEDLRIVARLARAARGATVLAHADIVTHREALAGLLADPRIPTGILATGGNIGQPFVQTTRTMRGRTVSAASAYHAVDAPNAGFLGVVKVSPDDAPVLAEAAERLASLVEGPLPPGWEGELERKRAAWRRWLAAARTADEDDGPPRFAAGWLADAEAGAAAGEDVALTADEESELARRAAVAPADVVSLLLVGLVRAGTHVGNSYLRRLFWARPLSREGVAEAAERITEHDEHRVLLESAVKANDGFFTTFFVSPYSKYLARWAARRGWTPNAVTLVSLVIGLLAAAAFAVGDRAGLVAGAILLQIAFTADCVDGQLARYTRTFSKFGAWLDSVFDRAKEYAVFAGLALGASSAGDDVWLLAGCALTLQTVRHAVAFSYATAHREAIGGVRQPPLEQPRDASDRRLRLSASGPFAVTEAVAPADPRPAPAPASRGRSLLGELPVRGLAAWRVIDRLPGARWVKRMVAFPIGERFAAVSITAALWSPRVTFVVLLAWGSLALVYGIAGLVLRSLSR